MRSDRKYKGNNRDWYYTTRRKNSRKKVKRMRNKEIRRGRLQEQEDFSA